MSLIGLCVFVGQQPLWAHPAGEGLIIRPPIHHDHFKNPRHWLLKRFTMRFWRYSGIIADRYFYIDTIYLWPLFILRRRIDCLSNPGISMETGRRNAPSMIKAKCMAGKSGISQMFTLLMATLCKQLLPEPQYLWMLNLHFLQICKKTIFSINQCQIKSSQHSLIQEYHVIVKYVRWVVSFALVIDPLLSDFWKETELQGILIHN